MILLVLIKNNQPSDISLTLHDSPQLAQSPPVREYLTFTVSWSQILTKNKKKIGETALRRGYGLSAGKKKKGQTGTG